jgi:hypothetical protein
VAFLCKADGSDYGCNVAKVSRGSLANSRSMRLPRDRQSVFVKQFAPQFFRFELDLLTNVFFLRELQCRAFRPASCTFQCADSVVQLVEERVEQTVVGAAPPSRNRPHGQVILVVLLVTLPMLALLVREQSRVIDAQRVLIRQLAIDSDQLNAMRVRELQNRAKPAAPSPKTPPADTQQQPSPAPKRKNHKRHESKQAPAPPQEYPATRPLPARKSV